MEFAIFGIIPVIGMLLTIGVPVIVIIAIIKAVKTGTKEEKVDTTTPPPTTNEQSAGFDLQTFLGIKPRICEYCGGAVEKGVTKCQNCGAKVKK